MTITAVGPTSDSPPQLPSHHAPRRGGVAAAIEHPIARKAANWVAAALLLYWVEQRLWPAPAGVLLKGAVIGGLYAMIALGMALVYRANRIINFAQGDLGGAPASLAVLLVAAAGWSYFAAIPVGLAAGVLLGVAVEFVIIRRFAKAPRLILTVATIGIAQLLTVVEIGMPTWFHVAVPPQTFPSPFNFHFSVGSVVFQGNDVLAIVMVPLVIAALAWFLNRTHIGVAVRACSESADRASLLGVPVRRVNMVVWAVASLLATVAVILRAGVVGLPIGSALGLSVLVRTLAAAAIGRMERMPTIVGASLVLGIVESAVVWHTGRSDIVDLVVFIAILVALLVQRSGIASRAEEAAMSTWTALREVRPVPPELRRMPEVVWTRRALFVGITVFAIFVPSIFGVAKINLAIFLCAYLIIALSLLVLTGWAGQISLGQFAFVGVGSTSAAWMTLHWHIDILLVMLLAGLLGAAVAVVIGIPALRIRGLFLAVGTLGFTFACSSYFLSTGHFSWIPDQFSQVPRLPVFGRISLDTDSRYYYFSLVVLVFCMLAVRGLRRSRVGRVLIATRENERAVQSFGVSVTRAKLTAFAVSGFLASVAGVIILGNQHYLYGGQADPASGIDAFVMVVVGGLGSMTGVFSGAIYLEGLSWFKNSVPHAIGGVMSLLGTGVGLVIILIFRPGGIGSVLFQARDRLLRELAKRRGIIVPSLVADAAQGPVESNSVDVTDSSVDPPQPMLAATDATPVLAAAGAGRPSRSGQEARE